jgi:hypothetical protein
MQSNAKKEKEVVEMRNEEEEIMKKRKEKMDKPAGKPTSSMEDATPTDADEPRLSLSSDDEVGSDSEKEARLFSSIS